MIARSSLVLLALLRAAAAVDTETAPSLVCTFYDNYKAEIPDAETKCSCEEHINCFFPEECGDISDIPDDLKLESVDVSEAKKMAPTDTQCVTDLSLNISLNDAAMVVVGACGTYATQGFEETCIYTLGPLNFNDPTIGECTNATYGGNLCKCESCLAGKGIDIDCTEHHVNASTFGCQEYNANDMNSLLPQLGMDVTTDDKPEEKPATTASSESSDKEAEEASSSSIQKFGAVMVISSVFASILFL